MASGQFFDPLTLLRVAPLVTSTASLWFSADQHLFLNNFFALKRQRTNETVGPYFTALLPKGLVVIFTSYGLSVASGVGNFYSRPNGALRWYAAGAAFALAHFIFVPIIIPKIEALDEGGDAPDGPGADNMKAWLKIHAIRSITVDFPAWACFLVATLKTLKPV